jgi:hypothetical protein
MSEGIFAVPESMTFEQAMALTKSLLSGIERGEWPERAVERAIEQLVSSQNGARGFFVAYLADPGPLVDNPSSVVLQALRSSPAVVSPLLVKNLVMSAARGVEHRQKGDEENATGSERVRSRSARLIKLLQLPEVEQEAEKLMESLITGQGDYQIFLERWGYTEEQREVMRQALNEVR